MTRKDLARLFAKVFGLLILLGAAIDLPSTVYRFSAHVGGWNAIKVAYNGLALATLAASYFGPLIIYGAVGLGLMWWNGRIADQAAQSPGEPDAPLASADLKSIEASLVTVIGLYFLADGSAELCRLIFAQGVNYGLSGPPTSIPFWHVSWFELPWIVQTLMKLTIGAAFVLGRGATVAALHQARHWVRKWRAYPYQPD